MSTRLSAPRTGQAAPDGAAGSFRPGTSAPATSPAPAPHTLPADSEERTRDRVLNAVLEHGPVSAAELGDLLGFTPAAVRRHLDHLSRSGVIEVKRVAKAGAGAGRPARRYVLSSQGQSSLGDDYLDIAGQALQRLGEIAGPDAVREFAVERFSDMERRYAPEIEAAGTDITARARALSAALSRDGFVASAASIEAKAPLPAALSSVQLCQGHCPIQQLATKFPVFCDVETEVFSRLVGVDVRRLSTLARGGHVCTTHIPTGRPAAKGPAGPGHTTDSLGEVSNHLQERP
ncbi:putative ArsR family transcriptional regulator [Arthrobacter sp. PvP102]|uniref:helix-turn-helix transcriptional regulator n=1 Tax=unclassified Arthrobacter TaxID=235627 RepID=UPI0000526DA3|nr:MULTISPECIES: helix-turn-helix domain-containing protein [unclassified Arthrobacter]ABK03482.1 transcriptional regulator [Arthrobacter sp. FB24]MBP1231399.1 putative ArsR family transcriptional regulator [Arthrobacter sp. PvP103]MBP1236534.1 putative ArsR family transcriptional regulator [Arthrobacter sp. PvP102]